MEIVLGYDFNKNEIITNKEKNVNQVEKNILEQIANYLSLSDYNIVANSDDYTTLEYKEYDIVRLKYSQRTKWISIFMTNNDKKENIDNVLFDAQKNKKQLLWKSIITDDIDIYLNFIKNKCSEIDKI